MADNRVRIRADLLKRIDELACEEGISVKTWIERALYQAMSHNAPPTSLGLQDNKEEFIDLRDMF